MFSELTILLATTTAAGAPLLAALWLWRRAEARRRSAETELAGLRRSERQLREVLERLPLALFLKDADSRFVMMNAACEQTFGQRYAAMAGTHGGEHYPVEQQAGFLAADRAAFASRRLWCDEEWLWHAGLQQDRRLLTYKQPLYDENGQPALLIGMCVDVTERHASEDALAATLRQLRELSDLQENTRGQERHRHAQILHDSLGQSLMALKLDASMLASATRSSHPRLYAHTQRVQATLDKGIQTVRSLINELHPSTLELGLPAATDWLLKQQERRGGMHCQLHLISDSAVLAQPRTWAIFRMIQEALYSIQAYAQATRLDVSLDLRASALLVVISDNGLDCWAAGSRRATLSMLALRERVSAHGGQLTEDSMPGRGTTLTFMFPGNEKREAAASRLHTPADA